MTIEEIKPFIPEVVEFSEGHWGFPELIPYGVDYGSIFEMIDWDGEKTFKNGEIGCITDFRCVNSNHIQNWGCQVCFKNKKRVIAHIKSLHKKALRAIQECKDYDANRAKEMFWTQIEMEEKWEKFKKEIDIDKVRKNIRFTDDEKKLALSFSIIDEGFDMLKTKVNGHQKWVELSNTKGGKYNLYILENLKEYNDNFFKSGKHIKLKKTLYHKFNKKESEQIFAYKCYYESKMKMLDEKYK